MPKPQRDDDEIVGAATLAKRLGLVATSISRLAVEGVLVKAGRGRYRAWASARSYLAHRERLSAARASPAVVARSELLKIQAERAQLALQREKARLVDVDDAEIALTVLARSVRAEVLSLTARIAGSLPHVSREDAALIDELVRGALTELADTDPAETAAEWAQVEAERAKRGK